MSKFIIFCLLFLAASLFVFPNYANEFTVTSTDDRASGACNPGDCSLREAIVAANGFSEDNTIALGEGLYHLTLAGSDDTGAKGDLDILNAGHRSPLQG
jgi:CSLREA domain-containing protein